MITATNAPATETTTTRPRTESCSAGAASARISRMEILRMSKKKHKTKAELLRELNYTAKCRRNLRSASFSGLAVYLTHILVFEEHWRPGQIRKLHEAIAAGLEDASFDVEAANDRLNEKAGIKIEIILHRDQNTGSPENRGYINMLRQKLNEAEDEINEYCQRWFLIAYSYLMDNGFGSKRINRINDAIKSALKRSEGGVLDDNVFVLWWELIDAGYYIEMPKELNKNG